MAKSKKKSNFFHDASLQLNREIKQKQKEQSSTKQSGFMKQLNDHKTRDQDTYSKAKAQGQNDSLFRGQDVIDKKKVNPPSFNRDAKDMDPTQGEGSPQGSFQVEQRVNLMRKGVK